MSELASFQSSTKPYVIRAIHQWCVDTGLTPHILVVVNAQTRVPLAYVKDGEIVLNLNYSATKDLLIDNDAISFSARFGGVAQHLYIPISAVRGVFARENGQGMFFEVAAESEITASSQAKASDEVAQAEPSDIKPAKKKPTLTIVK